MDTPHNTVDPSVDPSDGTTESPLLLGVKEAQENLARLNENALAFVRARPVACVVGAVALGFIIGKIAARY